MESASVFGGLTKRNFAASDKTEKWQKELPLRKLCSQFDLLYEQIFSFSTVDRHCVCKKLQHRLGGKLMLNNFIV